ncbi:Retrotransposon-derived protein PEG10 [Ceratobasidium theobromae]|uniref:Retrotransposon-derived protein PEG10 n=1 Tax=Ceratobasidium theobromae TaxID=1582974 RepID=A0A5N5Q7X4_9AGAM|nr:Retrotransposon-derived protein PEG10 [Ceratobasidium theobromae]
MPPRFGQRSTSTTRSVADSPLLGSSDLPGPSTNTPAPESASDPGLLLFGPQDRQKLDQLYNYLIGPRTGNAPALHGMLEKQMENISTKLDEFKASILQEVSKSVSDALSEALTTCSSPTTTAAYSQSFLSIPETPRTSLDTGKRRSSIVDTLVPIKDGAEDPSGKGKGVKFESPLPPPFSPLLALPGSSSTRPQPSPIFPTPLPTSQATPGPVPPPTLQGGDQAMQQTADLAALLERALSQPLEQIVRAATQTPGPTQLKSKIPAPEKYDGKKGPAAKSFMLDCKTYFAANPSSFPSDESRIIFVLSTLKEGIAKQWGQYYLSQIHQGHMDGILADWDVFEAGFLSNWTDPATLLTAERKLGQLQQHGSANDYATEFCILQTDLEWDDSTYMAAFRKGLKSEVRAKLIEHSLGCPIRTLDDLITTACLIDDALFMARKERQQHTANTPSSSSRPAQGKSAGFVTRDIQDRRRKAGECVKSGDSAHKFENCPNGWKTRSGERPRTENGKIGSLIDLEDSTESGKA